MGTTAGSGLLLALAIAAAANTVRNGPVRNRSIEEPSWLVPSGNKTQPKPAEIPVASIMSERPLICVASSSVHPPRRSSALRTTGCTASFRVHQLKSGRVTRSCRPPITKFFGCLSTICNGSMMPFVCHAQHIFPLSKGRVSIPVTSLVLNCAARIRRAIQYATFDHNGEPGVFPVNFGIGDESNLSMRMFRADFDNSGRSSPRWSFAPSFIGCVIDSPHANVGRVRRRMHGQSRRSLTVYSATLHEGSNRHPLADVAEHAHARAALLGLPVARHGDRL